MYPYDIWARKNSKLRTERSKLNISFSPSNRKMSVNHVATCKDSLLLNCTVSLDKMKQSKYEGTWMNKHFCTEWICVAACRGVTLTMQGPFWERRFGQPEHSNSLFISPTVKKRNEEIKTTPSNIVMSNLLLPVSSFLFFSVSVLSCLIFWPLPAVCACATFGTSPPTGTCARPGNPNQDALLGSVQLTRLGNCTLTLIFMAGP